MKKCKHAVGGVMVHAAVGVYSRWTRECLTCGTWLPLGPANEDSEAVRVEMRASELAADMAIGVGVGGHRPDQIVFGHCWHWWSEEDSDETCCYCGHTFPYPSDAHDTCPAALLARAIVEHEGD